MDIMNQRAIKSLCDQGYATSDPSYYAKIDAILSAEPQTEQILSLRRLCEAGPTLSSKRFAYPHIADKLNDPG
jgi:hypothetical protein